MLWFITILLIVGAGFYFLQRMATVKQETRVEQQIGKTTAKAEEHLPEVSGNTLADSENDLAAVIPETAEATALKEAVLAEVIKRPGMKQTELYPFLADINKRQLQKLIKEMADSGVLRRDKQGNSYLLYPAE
jgi:hypothetical protein